MKIAILHANEYNHGRSQEFTIKGTTRGSGDGGGKTPAGVWDDPVGISGQIP